MNNINKSTHGRFDKVGIHHMTVNTRHCLWIPGEQYNDLSDKLTAGFGLLRSFVNTGRRVPMYFDGVSVEYSEDLSKPGTCTFKVYVGDNLLTNNTVCISSEMSISLWPKANGGIGIDRLPCPGMPWLVTDIDWLGWVRSSLSGDNLLWVAGLEASIALTFATDPITLKRLGRKSR